jgi:SAM-dependent methyltransferase
MLDCQTYRASEDLARSLIPSWRVSQIHNLDHFERAGFPVRLKSFREVGLIIDTMQENRFEPYMTELGGLTDAEHEMVMNACRDMIRFQLTYLPHRPPVLSISTILSAFAIYNKLRGFNPEFRSVLEIGPGCGYVSFLLKQHAPLHNYSQIEACESFYILQNLVNIYCFGDSVDERAIMPEDTPAVDYFVNSRPDMEFSPQLHLGRGEPKCTHYPWWRIGEILSQERSFDVVTSNANLLEFNRPALDDYLTLLGRALKPDGVFLVQCTGFNANGTVPELLETLYSKGFAPLMFVTEKDPVEFPRPTSSDVATLFGPSASAGKRSFTTNNAVFVKRGHPLFEKYYNRGNYKTRFVSGEEIVERMFFARPSGRKDYSLSHFVEETERSLQS